MLFSGAEMGRNVQVQVVICVIRKDINKKCYLVMF